MVDVARSIRTAKKAESLPVWRATAGLVLALLRRCQAERISYGEALRRAVSYWLTNDQFHDFDSNQVVYGASLFPDSSFDNGIGESLCDTSGKGKK